MSATEPTKEDQQQEPSQQHHRDGHGGDQVDPVAGSVEVELEDASPAPPQELGVDSPPDGGHEHDQVLTPHFEADPAATPATVENVVDASLSVLPGVFALHREEPAAAAHHHEVTPESQPLLPHDDTGDARGSQLPIHSLPHEPHEGLYEESYQGHGDHGHHEAHGLHDDGHTNATNLEGHVHGDESMEDANAPVAVHGEVSPQMEEDHEAAAAAIAAAEEAVGAVLDDVGVGRPSHDEHGEQQHYDLHVHGLDVGLDYAQMEGEEKHGQHDPQYGQGQHGSQYGQQQLGHGQHLELEESHDDLVDPDDDGLYQQTDDEVALAAAAAAAAVQAADGMSVMVDQALLETAAAAAASQVAAAAGNDDLSHLDNPENPHHHQHSHHHSTHDASHTHTDPYSHLQTHHSHHEIHDHHSHGVIIPSLPEHNSIEHSHVNATSAQEMSGETHAGVASTSPAPAPGNHARITNQNQSTHTLSAEANSLNHAVPSGSVSTTSSTDDQKDSLLAARRLKDRRRYATMSPTQRAAYNAHRRELYHRQGEEARKRRRERERTRYHSLEGEEKKKRNARRAQLERERYNKLSKEELAERNAKRRERAKMKKMMMANGGEAAAGASGEAAATAPAAAVAPGASGEPTIGSEVKTEGRNKKIHRTDESQSDVTQEMNFHMKHEELTEDPTTESQDVNYVLHGEEEVPPQVDETVTVPEDIMADAVSAAAEVAERVVTAAAEAAAAAAAEALQHGDEGDEGNEMIVV